MGFAHEACKHTIIIATVSIFVNREHTAVQQEPQSPTASTKCHDSRRHWLVRRHPWCHELAGSVSLTSFATSVVQTGTKITEDQRKGHSYTWHSRIFFVLSIPQCPMFLFDSAVALALVSQLASSEHVPQHHHFFSPCWKPNLTPVVCCSFSRRYLYHHFALRSFWLNLFYCNVTFVPVIAFSCC